jgi:hypothetical protein
VRKDAAGGRWQAYDDGEPYTILNLKAEETMRDMMQRGITTALPLVAEFHKPTRKARTRYVQSTTESVRDRW